MLPLFFFGERDVGGVTQASGEGSLVGVAFSGVGRASSTSIGVSLAPASSSPSFISVSIVALRGDGAGGRDSRGYHILDISFN